MENSAPVPQTAFASVNQSARWNSRIIEKGCADLSQSSEPDLAGQVLSPPK